MFECFNKDRKSPKEVAPEVTQMKYYETEYVPELPPMTPKGSYPNNKPEGIILHSTAGNQNANVIDTIKYAIKKGYSYAVLPPSGVVYEQFDVTKYGNHAGRSKCPITNRTNVSRFYVGIEIQSAGLLELRNGEYYTWFGKKVPPMDCRHVSTDKGYKTTGVFQKFTEKQELNLIEYCVSMCREYGFSPDFILGHDEVSIGRKSDVGGCLSVNMDDFRELIKGRL